MSFSRTLCIGYCFNQMLHNELFCAHIYRCSFRMQSTYHGAVLGYNLHFTLWFAIRKVTFFFFFIIKRQGKTLVLVSLGLRKVEDFCFRWRNRETLEPIIQGEDAKNSVIDSDKWPTYSNLNRLNCHYLTVNHRRHYVRVNTQAIKRSRLDSKITFWKKY